MEKIRVGQQAPDFKAKKINGDEIALSVFKGKKVWLSFYRYAKCPLCNLYLSQMLSHLPELESKNINVIAVFESEAKHFPKFLGGHPTETYNVVPDPQKNIYALYGVEKKILATVHPKVGITLIQATIAGYIQGIPDTDLSQLPAHFLIDDTGIVKFSHYGKHAADHIEWKDIADFAGIK